MLIVPCDGVSVSGLAWVFKLLSIKHTETSIWHARTFISTV